MRLRAARKLGIGCTGLIVILMFCGICGTIANASNTYQPQTADTGQASPTMQQVAHVEKPTPTPSPTPTLSPTPTPTPQPIHYPPTTAADLRGLAAKGDASAIHTFHSESVGLTGVCPQPKREVTVDPSVTGQQLAEDLLAYFYSNQLDSDVCGSVVFADHDQSEAGNGYTAGRILVNTTDSSGADINDPNATDVKYKLTLDTGSFDSSQEYMVTY